MIIKTVIIVILILINSYIIKHNNSDSDNAINDQNKDNKKYLKNRVYVNDDS